MTTLQPVVLAAGLGSRLRPRTLTLPKPILPVDGRPLLWYTLAIAKRASLVKPIVVVDYLSRAIETYFQDQDVDFIELRDMSMLEAFFQACEARPSSDAYLCLSSDVLIPPGSLMPIVEEWGQTGKTTLAVTHLDGTGHKKWHFVVEDGFLRGIEVSAGRTNEERLGLIVAAADVALARAALPSPVIEESLQARHKGFQAGWTLLLSELCSTEKAVVAIETTTPTCNVNIPEDFTSAEAFVREHWSTL